MVYPTHCDVCGLPMVANTCDNDCESLDSIGRLTRKLEAQLGDDVFDEFIGFGAVPANDWRDHVPMAVIEAWKRMTMRERQIAFVCAIPLTIHQCGSGR